MRYLKGSYLNTSTTPAITGAVGKWNLADQFDAARSGTWPTFGFTATGGTATTGNGYNQWSFTTTGSNTFTVTIGGTVYYAIVAGGGGSGYGTTPGGGGGGGVITGQTTLTAGTYTIVVGAGGLAGTSSTGTAVNGGNSSAFGFTAVGGGGSGGYTSGLGNTASMAGGSGGGVSFGGTAGGAAAVIAVGVAGQGWSGGACTQTSPYPEGGGGGAGGIGISGSGSTGGNGGPGLGVYLPVSNTTVYYGGGGGAGANGYGASAGSGGTGGGGNGNGSSGTAGATNTGGGAGGGGGSGSAGGSGIVVIWSPIATPAKTPYVNYLVVAGGGGSALNSGGGGGGVLQGLAQLSTGTTYTITVGSGGSGSPTNSYDGTQGSNSIISGSGLTTITAIGGGVGGAYPLSPNNSAGGSGGGGTASQYPNVGAGTTGQGYSGGKPQPGNVSPYAGGGGGGFGMVGYQAPSTSLGGNGGDGFTTYIANPATYSWSNYFNGSNAYIALPGTSNIYPINTENFTVEFWLCKSSAWNTSNMFILDCADYGGFQIWVNVGGSILRLGSSAVAGILDYSYSSLSVNSWNHFAYTRSGNTFTLYVNGTSVATTTNSVSFPSSTTNQTIGYTATGGSGYYNGYISNLRIVKGSVVYTSNFTPPTSQLTAITGTSLLTCQSPSFKDNSSNNWTLTTAGSPAIASQNPFGASYAGGGGGSQNSGSGTYGGMGGGGNGSPSSPVAGVTNTGGGGGGTGNTNPAPAGGSGVVILAYPSTYAAAASTTGSPTLTTANGYNVYKFNASGSITF